ncbi:hypothetical protein K491DRAFT_679098 [Lophiostoma macrostomum CBS 122681]|uniref:Uncharacterized protein n=1 Tax=Lophiostoma macrostomum CBS 122681 TaxID=1314788 RepID=A0A6A6T8C9_9PLEO|nr:hypothetical protein K491DRAFT_679098 [Lophiostoma macrostomum CBS 122681]
MSSTQNSSKTLKEQQEVDRNCWQIMDEIHTSVIDLESGIQDKPILDCLPCIETFSQQIEDQLDALNEIVGQDREWLKTLCDTTRGCPPPWCVMSLRCEPTREAELEFMMSQEIEIKLSSRLVGPALIPSLAVYPALIPFIMEFKMTLDPQTAFPGFWAPVPPLVMEAATKFFRARLVLRALEAGVEKCMQSGWVEPVTVHEIAHTYHWRGEGKGIKDSRARIQELEDEVASLKSRLDPSPMIPGSAL